MFAEVRLRSASVNLLTAQQSTGGDTSSNTTGFSTVNGDTITYDTTRQQQGAGSIKAAFSTGSGYGVQGIGIFLSGTTALLPNTTYTFSAYYYNPSTSLNPGCLLSVQGNVVGGASNSITGTVRNAWDRLSVTFTTDSSATSVALYVLGSGGAIPVAGEAIWGDAFQLELGSTANSWALPSAIGYTNSTVLRSVSGLSFNTAYADAGAISFSMPVSDAEALGVTVGSIVEVMPNGQSLPNMWFTLDTSQSTKTSDGALMIQFSGKSLINWLTDCIVYPSTWHPSITPSDYIISTSGTRTQTVPRNYILISSSVTFQGAADTVTTPAAHNLAVGDRVQFATVVTTTGIVANTQYYVKTVPSTTTFTLAATLGGATIDLINNGTGTNLTKNFPTYTDATKATLNGHSFENASPGTILQTLIARGVERGGLAWLTASSFTGSLDSAGAAWASTLTTTYTNGTTLLQVIQDLSDRRLIDYRMDQNSLKVYNYGSASNVVHYTADQITLRRGAQVVEQTRTQDASSTATSVLILGDFNALEELSDTSLQAAFRRRREQLVTQGGITDIPTLNLLAGAQLNISGHIQVEDTLGISDQNILPWINFREGDWVWADFDGTLKNIQVQQIAASGQDANNLQVGLTLGDLIRNNDEKNQRLIDNITGQGAGNYGALPSQNDYKAPAAPSGVTASATSYRDQNGNDAVQVTITWTAPTTNSDGTTLTDLDHYEIQYQIGTSTSWSTTANIPASTVPLAAFLSNLPPGPSFTCQVRAVDSTNNASPWATQTNTVSALPKVTTTPATPSTPVVTSTIQSLKITWDGLTAAAGTYDSSWDHTDIHLSTVSGFTPSSATKVGVFSTLGGTFTIMGLAYGSTYYCRLIAFDKSGNQSFSSAQSGGNQPAQLSDPDLPAKLITGAKIADGAINTAQLTVAAFGDTVVPNGGFEDVATAATDTAGSAHWKIWTTQGTGTTITRDTTTSATGTSATKIHLVSGTPVSANLVNSDGIPTSDNDLWYVRFKALASRDGVVAVTALLSCAADSAHLLSVSDPNNPQVAFAGQSGSDEQLDSSGTTGLLSTSWQTFEGQVLVPTGLAAPLKMCQLILNAGQPSDNLAVDVYIDDVTLAPVRGAAYIKDASIVSAKIVDLDADKINAGTLSTITLDAGTMTGTMTEGALGPSNIYGTYLRLNDHGGGILMYETVPTVALDTSTSGTFTPSGPAGSTVYAKIECWGGGGGGGESDGFYTWRGGGGGGGGEYAREDSVALVAGTSYSFTVGAGGSAGSGGSGKGGKGGTTTFSGPIAVIANGGSGGLAPWDGNLGGAGGSGSSNLVHFSGGAGGKATSAGQYGAGGGGSGGSQTKGNKGNNTTSAGPAPTGGAAVTDGGAGGTGGTNSAGLTGTTPGSGGGGGGSTSGGASHNGAAGRAGRVRITTFTNTLVSSVAPAAGTDPATGVAYPLGVRVYHPEVVGVPGGYYRQMTYSKALTSGVADTVSAVTTVNDTNGNPVLWSDYGGCFSSGAFTPPADGVYSIHFEADNLLTNANNARIAIQVNGTAVARSIYTGGGGGVNVFSASLPAYFLKGSTDVVTFSLITAGPNVTVTGTISVMKVA